MKKIISLVLIVTLIAGISAEATEYHKIVSQARARQCMAIMRTLQSAIELYMMEYDNVPKISDLTDYLAGGKLPVCPVTGKCSYSIVNDSDGIHVKCSVHNTIDDLFIPYVSEKKEKPEEQVAPSSKRISEILMKRETTKKPVRQPISKISEIIGMKSKGMKGNTAARIQALINALGKDAQIIVKNNRSIEALLFKNWVFHTEFESDLATLLPIFRESNEAFGNLGNTVKDLKAEVFDPSQFCFAELESSLNKSGTAFSESYSALRQGKEKISSTRKKYTSSRSEYAKTFEYIDKLIDQFEDVIQPSPSPSPAPVPPVMTVDVRRQHINPGKYDVVNESTPLGAEIMKKVRHYMKNEMGTLERIQLKFALSGANGFSYAIVRLSNKTYRLYWWHVLDEVLDILPID